jgi:hypothetical protein
MTTNYVPTFLDAMLTLDIAVHYHHHKNKDGVVRKTARRLVLKQSHTGKHYLQLLIASQHPYAAFTSLQERLDELK